MTKENYKNIYDFLKNNNLLNQITNKNSNIDVKFNEFINLLKDEFEEIITTKWIHFSIQCLYDKLPYFTENDIEEIIKEIEKNKLNDENYLEFANFLKKKTYDKNKMNKLINIKIF